MTETQIPVNDIPVGNVHRTDTYEETLIASAGYDIALSIWRGQPDAGSFVFLPGTMVHPLFYEGFIDGLNLAGFTVVGVHPAGHGKSPRTKPVRSVATLVANARDAIGYTFERFGDPVAIMGSSQGGILTMAVAAVDRRLALAVPHNIVDWAVPGAIGITQIPRPLWPWQPQIVAAVRALARVAPGLPVPAQTYLDTSRVFGDTARLQAWSAEPLCLRSYPLAYIATLFDLDLSGLADGSITCPVVVVADRGDTPFDFAYTQRVFDRIVAPEKELLTFDCGRHLILNECVDVVLPPIAAMFRRRLTGTAGRASASREKPVAAPKEAT